MSDPMTDRAPRPEGMSDESDWRHWPAESQLARIADGAMPGPDDEIGGCITREQARTLTGELSRLRADGATLLPTDWLRAFDALLRRHEIPDGLIVVEFTAWAARVMKGARVGLDEALAAHSASFGALATISVALFDGEVDDYAALAQKIIARVRQLEADGATLRERVEVALTADVLAELVRRMDAYFRKRTQPTERDRSVEESRSYLMAVLFPASAPKEPTPR